MPRAKRKVEEAQQSPLTADAGQEAQNASAALPPQSPAEPEQPAGEPKKQWASSLPDPFGRYSIDLGDGRRLQLSRSSKWNQMQLRFVATKEGVDPKPKKEDGDTQWLRERGWNWRGDADTKAWTVQLLAPKKSSSPPRKRHAAALAPTNAPRMTSSSWPSASAPATACRLYPCSPATNRACRPGDRPQAAAHRQPGNDARARSACPRRW